MAVGDFPFELNTMALSEGICQDIDRIASVTIRVCYPVLWPVLQNYVSYIKSVLQFD